jgi:penicillin-insensitive murein endopeptidase
MSRRTNVRIFEVTMSSRLDVPGTPPPRPPSSARLISFGAMMTVLDASAAIVVSAALLAQGAPAPAPAAPPSRAAVAKAWNALRLPAPGPPRAIGSPSGGCLQGASQLPAAGPGYEVAHLERNRRFGHAALIAYLARLAAAARTARVGPLLVGDLSQPRGGPTPTGHRSHQTGLDADVGYATASPAPAPARARGARPSFPPVIDLGTQQPTAAWGARTVKLLGLAAAAPAVDRIFVNPAIKRLLCQGSTAKEAWQARLRPWWAHHDHFHVRLKCPPDSPLCVPQEPLADDGCGATLAWWFSADAQATRVADADAAEPALVLPEACAPLLDAGER